jgi:hypothetical protein
MRREHKDNCKERKKEIKEEKKDGVFQHKQKKKKESVR